MTLVIGHRGASGDHPENTIAAFEAAADHGSDWVELDVRRSRDGALVVHHDAVLPDGRALCDLDRADIPASVPDLDAALVACGSMGVNVEIKNGPEEPGFDPQRLVAEATLEVMGRFELDFIVSSFDLGTIEAVRASRPEVATGYLCFSPFEPLDALSLAVGGGHAAVHPFEHFVDPELVERAHGVGLAVYVWTVDDPDRIAALARMGVDGVITNWPGRAREVVDGLSPPR